MNKTKIKDLITRDNWCQGTGARDKYDRPNASLRNARKWCLMFWICKVYSPEEIDRVRQEICNEILNKGFSEVSEFNDHTNTSFEDVKDLVTKLDI